MDWQYFAVYLIVAGAFVHVLRQLLAVAAGAAKPSAACGSCPGCQAKAKPPELIPLDSLSGPPPRAG